MIIINIFYMFGLTGKAWAVLLAFAISIGMAYLQYRFVDIPIQRNWKSGQKRGRSMYGEK